MSKISSGTVEVTYDIYTVFSKYASLTTPSVTNSSAAHTSTRPTKARTCSACAPLATAHSRLHSMANTSTSSATATPSSVGSAANACVPSTWRRQQCTVGTRSGRRGTTIDSRNCTERRGWCKTISFSFWCGSFLLPSGMLAG